MPETVTTSTPEARPHNESREARRAADAPFLGAAALLSSDTVRSFYGADDYYLGRASGEGTIRSIIKKTDGTTEVIANGEGAQDALSKTLEAMHGLERVVTKPIMHLKIDGKIASFTELGHYTPKIAPTREAYAVPYYLDDILTNTGKGMGTYERTVEQEGWQQALFAQVGDYLENTPQGVELTEGLRVTSLQSLTPEQAVKLSLGIVQSVSKYSWIRKDEQLIAGGKREDEMTTMELLAEGMEHSDDPEWDGNGVCRNVASNVKAVFEALKANQGSLSMLNNTYVVYTAAYGGESYGVREREDSAKANLNRDPSGHAWNTFITIDKTGSSNITIVDATWAMGRRRDGSLKEPDYTLERMYESAKALAKKADNDGDAAWAMSNYLDRFVRMSTSKDRDQRQQFALTEWLTLVPTLLEADIPSVPSGVIGAAYRLGAKLDKSELQILFNIQQEGWIDNFDAILGKYIKGKTYLSNTARLTVRGDDLQRAIYDKLGIDKVQEYANSDTDFRIRVRETTSGVLPEFDPANNLADKKELSSLMKDAGLFGIGDKYYGDVVRGELLRAAGGNQAALDSVIGDMSDYDILRHYRKVRTRILKLQ